MPQFPSKERVERDGVLVYAEGDDISDTDLDELKRQGYDPASSDGATTVHVTERIERDGVLVAAEGDEIPAEAAQRLGINATPADAPAATKGRSTKKA